MSQAFVGEIITEVEVKTAKTNNTSYSFGFKVAGKKSEVINCVIWESMKPGNIEHLKLGSKVTIRGFYGKQKQENMDGFNVIEKNKELVVTWFKLENEGGRGAEERNHGGPEGYGKYIKDYNAAKRLAGYVQVKNPVRYVKAEDAIEVDGKWIYWGDFVYDQCPEEKKEALTEEFKKFMRGFSLFDIQGNTDNMANSSRYSIWKSALIKRAKEIYETKPKAENKEEAPKEAAWEKELEELNIE